MTAITTTVNHVRFNIATSEIKDIHEFTIAAYNACRSDCSACFHSDCLCSPSFTWKDRRGAFEFEDGEDCLILKEQHCESCITVA